MPAASHGSIASRLTRDGEGCQSTYGPLKKGISPYGFPAMSMKRVPGCASTTVNAPPAPRTAICERLARRALVPKLASPSSKYTKPLNSDGTGLLKTPPPGNSTSRMSPGVPSSTGEPSPTSTRTIASPTCLTGTSCGLRSCALGSTPLYLRARFTQKRTPRISVPDLPSLSSSSPIPSACHTPLPVRSFKSDPVCSRARSIAPPGPVLWPVLASPASRYHRLSNPRWGCLVSMLARSSVMGTTASWTRMKGSTCAYGMVRDGRGSRISRPITGRMWASSSRTTSRSLVSICVVMVRCSFRSSLSSLLLVVVLGRRFRSPAGAAARLVAEGLVLGLPTSAEGCTDLTHAPGWHVDAQVSAQVNRSVGDELYPRRLLGLLTGTLLQPVVQRTARAATYHLCYLLSGGVLRLDPRPLLDVKYLRQATNALRKVQAPASVVEDSHARGGVRPRVGDRQLFSICGRLVAHSLSPLSISGATRSRYSSRWRSMKSAMNGQNGTTTSPLARASSSAARASRPPRPMPP